MTKVKLDTLATFEGNAKIGDLPKIKASLAKLGQYKPIVVNVGTHTGRPNEILAGNNTFAAARELGWEEIEIHTVDVSQEEAVEINVLDNKLSELGTYDEKALAEQLTSLADFEITGYSSEEMDKLLRNTSLMADTFLSGMNSGIDTTQPAPPPAAAPAATFSSGDTVTQAAVATDSPAPAQQLQQPPAPPVDDTVYFTISYTVTGPQRDVIQTAIKRAQAATGAATSALALVDVAAAYK